MSTSGERDRTEHSDTVELWQRAKEIIPGGTSTGGMRVVDVSGELMGNLAEQGREVAVYKSFDPDNEWSANSAIVWGAQVHKGTVFFSDLVSGLWSVKVKPRTRPIS